MTWGSKRRVWIVWTFSHRLRFTWEVLKKIRPSPTCERNSVRLMSPSAQVRATQDSFRISSALNKRWRSNWIKTPPQRKLEVVSPATSVTFGLKDHPSQSFIRNSSTDDHLTGYKWLKLFLKIVTFISALLVSSSPLTKLPTQCSLTSCLNVQAQSATICWEWRIRRLGPVCHWRIRASGRQRTHYESKGSEIKLHHTDQRSPPPHKNLLSN